MASALASINVVDEGVLCDGQHDDTAALAALSGKLGGYRADNRPLPEIVFPAGICLFGAWPYFAFDHLTIRAAGECRLRYTGVDDAVTFDGSNRVAGVRNLRFGRFLIEARSTAGNGLVLKAVNGGSIIDVDVRGCGLNSAAIVARRCVCHTLNAPQVTGNVAWYDAGRPRFGLRMGDINAYCTVLNPVIEGPVTGIQFGGEAIGNTVIGGTAEGCVETGVVFAPDSRQNVIQRVDMEVNGVADVEMAGKENAVIDCDTEKLVSIAPSRSCVVRGGAHGRIRIAAGARWTRITDIGFNVANNGCTIEDLNPSLAHRAYRRGNYDMGRHIFDP